MQQHGRWFCAFLSASLLCPPAIQDTSISLWAHTSAGLITEMRWWISPASFTSIFCSLLLLQAPPTLARRQRPPPPGCTWHCTQPWAQGPSAWCLSAGSASGAFPPSWQGAPTSSSGPGTWTLSGRRCLLHLAKAAVLHHAPGGGAYSCWLLTHACAVQTPDAVCKAQALRS